MSAGGEITIERLDHAILYLAECVVAKGERFEPFLDKLITERERLANRQDPVARARAIIDQAKAQRNA